MLEKYVSKGSKKLRCGFTTGTCAAAASAGAARMLLSGKVIENITVITPSGNSVTVGLTDIKKENEYGIYYYMNLYLHMIFNKISENSLGIIILTILIITMMYIF